MSGKFLWVKSPYTNRKECLNVSTIERVSYQKREDGKYHISAIVSDGSHFFICLTETEEDALEMMDVIVKKIG